MHSSLLAYIKKIIFFFFLHDKSGNSLVRSNLHISNVFRFGLFIRFIRPFSIFMNCLLIKKNLKFLREEKQIMSNICILHMQIRFSFLFRPELERRKLPVYTKLTKGLEKLVVGGKKKMEAVLNSKQNRFTYL